VLRVYQVDGIPPTINKSNIICQSIDHIDPYVQVSFVGCLR